MMKFVFPLFMLTVVMSLTAAKPAVAAQTGDFVPRLIAAIDDYMSAYEVCLVRGVAVHPVGQQSAEQIGAAVVAACQKSDDAVRTATKRVRAFPSIENFMAGTSERISAFAVKLAKTRVASQAAH